MTTATTSREPQRISSLAARLDTILADRGIDATAAPAEAPSERVTALELAEARIPPRYRDALAGHEQVAAWVDEVALAVRPGPSGTRGIALGPSLLIAGPTVINGA